MIVTSWPPNSNGTGSSVDTLIPTNASPFAWSSRVVTISDVEQQDIVDEEIDNFLAITLISTGAALTGGVPMQGTWYKGADLVGDLTLSTIDGSFLKMIGCTITLLPNDQMIRIKKNITSYFTSGDVQRHDTTLYELGKAIIYTKVYGS